MRNILTILTLTLSQFGMTQYDTLSINKMFANVNADACLFTNPSISVAGYGIMDTSGTIIKTIYNSSFWIGAKDEDDSVRVCANMFASNAKDFKIGPVATDYSNQNFIDKYDYVYAITSSQIQVHKNQWHQSSYNMPQDIANWPGNGNTSNGEASLLAPFVDVNSNNIYEPQLGDYPLIRGDEAMYFILNDNDGNHPHSGGKNMDMEYHFMVYQYAVNGFLDSTTFINLKVINRSQETYNQLIVGNYVDFDIGGNNDDYIGSSVDKNMVFGYNGDSFDDSGSNPYKFGANPPACGVKLLNHNMNVAGYFNNYFGVQSDPTVDSTIWFALNAKWQNGAPYTFGDNGLGGTIQTNYMFSGNPNDSTAWNEGSALNTPGARRAFIASTPIDNFAPGDFICYDYAVLYSRNGGNNLLNVNGLLDVADSAQLFYNEQQHFYCQQVVLGLNETQEASNKLALYPNPAQNQISLYYEGDYNLSIIDLNGKTVFEQLNNTNSVIVELDIPNGLYVVKVISEGKTNYTKLIINK
ncbi:T9SS type A sorting domain-containing protein [Putridiphycobacter roseus]|uniref:T9SS type A sorting domain-containing protein n=1 Tax=Putridiphycobacter roseus TaxID=2219161 RepID=UPI003629E5F7